MRDDGFPWTVLFRSLQTCLTRVEASVVIGFGDVVGGDEATEE